MDKFIVQEALRISEVTMWKTNVTAHTITHSLKAIFSNPFTFVASSLGSKFAPVFN